MMANQPHVGRLGDALLTEIADELIKLKGEELAQFLTDIGEDPNALLEQSEAAMKSAVAEQGRARLSQARAALDAHRKANASVIVSFDLAKKRALFEAVKSKIDQTGDAVTIAARNQKIASEQDLDSVLEAFLRLGLIDEQGNLKD